MNKKLFVSLLAAVLTIAMAGCSYDDDIVIGNSLKVAPEKSFRLLCFGNSFTEDAMGYVPMILKQLAPDVDVTIGIAYIGGCPLQQHLANFRGETIADGDKVYSPQRYVYYKSENGSPWVTQRNKDAAAILADREWDMVTFQQNGEQAHYEWSEAIWPYICELEKLTNEKADRASLGWILIHGAYGASDDGFEYYWQGAADNARKTADALGCTVFPYGTAVQNLRLNGLKSLGDGSVNNLTVDNAHLQEGIGCYCAALTNALTILQLAGVEDVDIMDDFTEINEAAVRYMNVPGRNLGSGVIGMTPENRYLAKLAALAAIYDPYNLTDLSTVGYAPASCRNAASETIPQ